MELESFLHHASKIAENILNSVKGKDVLLIGHHDVDGVIASYIAYYALKPYSRHINFLFIDNLLPPMINSIKNRDEQTLIFFDIGAGNENKLIDAEEDLKKEVYIIDHHPTSNSHHTNKILNPYHFNIDGSKEICASSLSWILFYSYFSNPNIIHKNREREEQERKLEELIPLALLGCTADSQLDKEEFLGLNKMLENLAESKNYMYSYKDLSLFGTSTKPLYKSLAYLLDNEKIGERNALAILQKILTKTHQINIKNIRYEDLTKYEKEKLRDFLIINYYTGPQAIIEKKYKIKKTQTIKKEYDIKELSTILNAMCRLREYKKIIEFLNTGLENTEDAYTIYKQYSKLISTAMSKIKRYLATEKIKHNNQRENKNKYKEKVIIVPPELDIPPEIIGVVCNLLANKYEKNKIILGLSYDDNYLPNIDTKNDIPLPLNINKLQQRESQQHTQKIIKFSIRVGKELRGKIDIGKVIREISNQNTWYGSGHRDAAGGYIFSNYDRFLKRILNEIENNINNIK